MNIIPEKPKEKRLRFFLILAVAVVAVFALIVVLFNIISNSGSVNKSVIVYEINNEKVIRIGNLEAVISDSTASDFKCDKDNNRVFYTVSSSYSDGLYDLYYIEKDRSELTEPKIIDYGIEKDYLSVSGKIYYLKNNVQAGAKEAYCCDFKNKTINSFSSNVESVYPLEDSDTVYFIKFHGNERVLYKYLGETPIEVCRNISDIYLFNNSVSPHIFYESESKIYSGMTELYRADAQGAPELICDNTYKVLYNEYIPDENLYYFTSSSENISWSYVIADSYIESDKTLTRPKRDNFFSILGISVEYNQALREYQDKLVRDEIRDALNESVENKEFSAPVYTAYAYNSEGSHKITEKINPDKIYSVAKTGNPKLIFESSEIIQSSVDMSALVEIAQRSSMNEVIEYARSVVNSSIQSTGISIAGCNKDGNFKNSLEGYDKDRTVFAFSEDGGRVFALIRDSAGDRLRLYSFSIGSDLKPSEKVNVNNGISGYYFIGNSVIYLKSDVGKNTGDVYIFSGENNKKLSNAANALKVEDNDKIIVLKNYDNSTMNAVSDYYIINDSEEELISESIFVDNFIVNEEGNIAYIRSINNKNELCIYSDQKSSCVVNNANNIILYK